MNDKSPSESSPQRLQDTVEALRPVAAALGVDVDVQMGRGHGRAVIPRINVTKPILEVCHEAALLLKSQGLYTQNNRYVTVDDDGTLREMNEKRFISWLPRFCEVIKGFDEDKKPKKIDISSSRAAEILESDIFRASIPRITRVLPARLPVFTDHGKSVRLLKKGYDPEHEVYVTHSAPEVEEMDIGDALAFWNQLYKHIPWGDEGRSKAAQLSAQVGMFTQLLFPEALAVPLFYWNANMEGSGKSILAEMVVAPIYGHCETGDYGQGEEFLKRLMARALGYASYFFMDDVAGMVRSQALNRWVVQSYWTDRRMHSHEEMKVPKKCMTMITGNGATLSEDLIRRAVIVDLFSERSAAERLKDRGQENEITSEWLSDRKTRSKMLSALWAMVKYWASEGMAKASRPIPSFVTWSSTVGGIIETCGFCDPFAPAMLSNGGDKWQTEWKQLFEHIVRKFKPTRESTMIPIGEWCAASRELGLYVEVIDTLEMTMLYMQEKPHLWKCSTDGSISDDEKRRQALRYMTPQGQAASFGRVLRKDREGRTFDVDGISYMFSDRRPRHAGMFITRLN